MATGLCRYDAYVIIAAQLDGTLGGSGEFSVDVCNEPARHVTVIIRAGDGLGVRVDVELCPVHDRELAETAPGYVRSIKKRIPSTT